MRPPVNLPMRPSILLLLCSWFAAPAVAQTFVEKLTDLMEIKIGPPPADTTRLQPAIVMAPIVYFEPRTSFGFGFGARLLFKPRGAGPEVRTSNIPIGGSYTLNNQLFFTSGYTIFFPEEKWLFRGNLNYIDFPQSFYGVGNFTTEDDRREITYQRLLVEPLLLRRVREDVFLGAGLRYDVFFGTELLEATESLPAGTNLQDELGSTAVGGELAFSFDKRNNVINATEGLLVEITQGFFGRLLGGTHDFRLTKLDLRAYRRLAPRQVLGGQFFARYADGNAPVQELSGLGGRELLRGYPEERFRDRLAVFGQAEWRWQALRSIGLVGYAGLGRVAPDPGELSFSGMYYSLGTGLRVTIIPDEDINLRLDVARGLGPTPSWGFYLGLGEAF